MAADPKELRRIRDRKAALYNERSTWLPDWQNISKLVQPRSGRYTTSDRNRGGNRANAIYDGTATRAARALAAGMMAGMTSPARPWFRLGLRDKDLQKYHPVKIWLHDQTRKMQAVLASGNTYRALHTMYSELGPFGTSASILMPNRDEVVWHYPITIGSFAIATSDMDRVDTLYREYDCTIGQLAQKFGKDKLSPQSRMLFEANKLDTWVTVVHAIEPRLERDPDDPTSKGMPWASYYFEEGQCEQFLRESGFKRFRALVPRWDVRGGDIWGTGPGAEALGDIKQLQHNTLRKGQGIDNMVQPALQVPTAMKGQPLNRFPGGITYTDVGSAGIKPLFEGRIDLSELRQDTAEIQRAINSTFYVDLFLMLHQADKNGLTATEVAERHEEKLIMLGPVLERLTDELLEPLIDLTFEDMVAAGIVDPPPEELAGQPLEIEYTSMLAQAQRAIGINSIDRFAGTIGQVAALKPGILDTIDEDVLSQEYADALGINPNIIVAGERLALIRSERAKAQAAQAAVATAQAGAAATRDLSAASRDNPDITQSAINLFSGYSGA